MMVERWISMTREIDWEEECCIARIPSFEQISTSCIVLYKVPYNSLFRSLSSSSSLYTALHNLCKCARFWHLKCIRRLHYNATFEVLASTNYTRLQFPCTFIQYYRDGFPLCEFAIIKMTLPALYHSECLNWSSRQVLYRKKSRYEVLWKIKRSRFLTSPCIPVDINGRQITLHALLLSCVSC